MPEFALLSYQRSHPMTGQVARLTVGSDGQVRRLNGAGGELGLWLLEPALRIDVLERLTLALDDSDFPRNPGTKFLPDGEASTIALEASGRSVSITVPSTMRYDGGGWGELLLLLESLLEQTSRALGEGPPPGMDTGILPDCLSG